MADLTPDDIAALRVRLSDIGFDPVGLYAYRIGDEEDDRYLLDDDSVIELTRVYRSGSGPWMAEDELFVSTSDARTRDALARWVAGRVGLSPSATAPSWHPDNYEAPSWRLSAWYTEAAWFRAPYSANFRGMPILGEYIVPALAALDARDARRLPDGSRLVDALALAAVAVHVGGTRG